MRGKTTTKPLLHANYVPNALVHILNAQDWTFEDTPQHGPGQRHDTSYPWLWNKDPKRVFSIPSQEETQMGN